LKHCPLTMNIFIEFQQVTTHTRSLLILE
jgi:hypothetical protein